MFLALKNILKQNFQQPLFTYTQTYVSRVYVSRIKSPLVNAAISGLFLIIWAGVMAVLIPQYAKEIGAVCLGFIALGIVVAVFRSQKGPSHQHQFYQDCAYLSNGGGKSPYRIFRADAVSVMTLETVTFWSETFYVGTLSFKPTPRPFFGKRAPVRFGIEGTADLKNLIDWGRERGIDVQREPGVGLANI